MSIDKETQKLITEQQEIHNFVLSGAWSRIKDKLTDKINKITDIRSLPTEGLSKVQRADEMDRRAGAASLVEEWMAEIEGISAQYENQTIEATQKDSETIKRFE